MLWSPQLVIPQPKPVVAAGGGGGSPTTWNPSDKSANMTLSGGNLIATAAADNVGVRSVASVAASQKVYFEHVLTSVGPDQPVGFAKTSSTLGGIPGLETGLSFGVNKPGFYYDQASADHNTSITASWATGDNIGVAYDSVNNKFWARINGGNWNSDVIANQNPATNTGGRIVGCTGTLYAILQIQFNTEVGTTKFSSVSWTYAAPSGFTQLA